MLSKIGKKINLFGLNAPSRRKNSTTEIYVRRKVFTPDDSTITSIKKEHNPFDPKKTTLITLDGKVLCLPVLSWQ
jgi:hypothetical protein